MSIDELLATRLMGWPLLNGNEPENVTGFWWNGDRMVKDDGRCSSYWDIEDPAVMVEIMEALRRRWHVQLACGEDWECVISEYWKDIAKGCGPTPMLAVANAAARAVETKGDTK